MIWWFDDLVWSQMIRWRDSIDLMIQLSQWSDDLVRNQMIGLCDSIDWINWFDDLNNEICTIEVRIAV